MFTPKILLLFLLSVVVLESSLQAQNIGINTDGSAGQTLLHTKNTTAATDNILRIQNTIAAQKTGVEVYNSGNVSLPSWLMYNPASTTRLDFQAGGALDVMTLTYNGLVGINTTNPGTGFGDLMEIKNGNLFIRNPAGSFFTGIVGTGSTSTGLVFRKDGLRHAAFKWDGTKLYLGDGSADCCVSDNWNSPQTTWDISTGRVGMGITAPAMKLHVVDISTNGGDASIYGNSTGASGQVYGVLGQVASTSGNATGVKGVASGASGATNGVWGTNVSTTTDAAGVWGESSAATGSVYGVFGTAASTTSPASGVVGKATGATGLVYGVTGISLSSGGIGVFGDSWNTTAGGTVYGVYGRKRYGMTTGTGYGVYGTSEGTATTNIGGYFTATGATNNYGLIVPSGGGRVGVGTSSPTYLVHVTGAQSGLLTPLGYFENTDNSGTALYGANTAAASTTTGTGVYGSTNQWNGFGVYAASSNSVGSGATVYYAMRGINTAASGTSYGSGLQGKTDQSNGLGVVGYNTNASGTGIFGVGQGASLVYIAGGAGGQFSGVTIGSYSKVNNSALNSLGQGTNYFYLNTISGVVGYHSAAAADQSYNFGIHGASASAGSLRVGAVLGTRPAGSWSCMGYRSSGALSYSIYGVDAAYVSGAGRIASDSLGPVQGIGFGFYSGMLGGWVRGEKYGINVKGERYGLYVDGKTYTNDVIVQLSTNPGSRSRSVTYVPTSTTVDVYAKGTANLVNGRAYVKFDAGFRNIISSDVPVIVTITPMGMSNGVYIESVDEVGFSVAENNSGACNVRFSWIAVGTKKGFENTVVPEELLSNEYDVNMSDVMFNENDLERAGKSYWWDGTKLRFDAMPKALYTEKDDSKDRMIVAKDVEGFDPKKSRK